jgi:hypothetical protein
MRYVVVIMVGDSLGNLSDHVVPMETDTPMSEILRNFLDTRIRIQAELKEIWGGRTTREYNTAWYENMSKIEVNGRTFDYSALFYAPDVGDPVKKVMTIDEWFEMK